MTEIVVNKNKKRVLIYDKTVPELYQLTEQYNIPKDFLTGITDPFEIARMESVETRDGEINELIMLQFVVPHTYQNGFKEFKTRAVAMINQKDTIILASNVRPEFLEETFKNFEESKTDFEKFVLQVFWRIQCESVRVLRWLHQEIEDMQFDVEKSSKNQEIYRLMALDKSLAYIQTATQNNRNVLELISNLDQFQNRPSLKELMHDILVESYQAESMVDEGMRLIDQLSDLFSNVISNNLNNIMKVLTSITIVLTIPTIIGGLWGMNVPVPFATHPNGFWITNGFVVVISAVTIYWLKKRDLM